MFNDLCFLTFQKNLIKKESDLINFFEQQINDLTFNIVLVNEVKNMFKHENMKISKMSKI